MKRLIFLLALLDGTGRVSAQFTGTLVYTTIHGTYNVTTVRETANMGRIDCRLYDVKSGQPDSSTGHDQNPLIFDFNAGKLTHLQYERNMAMVGPFMDVWTQAFMKVNPADIVVSLVGTETVNGYVCKHFSILNKKDKRDLWITSSLGNASLYPFAAFMYCTPGNIMVSKMNALGGYGVVVRAVAGPSIINLVSVSTTAPASTLFQIPTNYTTIDQTAAMQQQLTHPH